jgi:hypothetical protein
VLLQPWPANRATVAYSGGRSLRVCEEKRFQKKCYVAKMLLEIVGSKMLNERMLDGKMLSIF